MRDSNHLTAKINLNLVRTAHWIQSVSILKTGQLMAYSKVTDVCFETHTTRRNVLLVQNVEFLYAFAKPVRKEDWYLHVYLSVRPSAWNNSILVWRISEKFCIRVQGTGELHLRDRKACRGRSRFVPLLNLDCRWRWVMAYVCEYVVWFGAKLWINLSVVCEMLFVTQQVQNLLMGWNFEVMYVR